MQLLLLWQWLHLLLRAGDSDKIGSRESETACRTHLRICHCAGVSSAGNVLVLVCGSSCFTLVARTGLHRFGFWCRVLLVFC